MRLLVQIMTLIVYFGLILLSHLINDSIQITFNKIILNIVMFYYLIKSKIICGRSRVSLGVISYGHSLQLYHVGTRTQGIIGTHLYTIS